MKYIIPLLLLVCVVFACQDVIDVDLEEGVSQIMVDAWLNNKPEDQVIQLRKTAAYFDNSGLNPVLGAEVKVSDDMGNVYYFVDTNNNGNYTLPYTAPNAFGTVGRTYTLNINTNGLQYSATSTMNPTTVVDSITYTTGEAPFDGGPDGAYAEFFARDLPGLGNTYWIKTYKNGQFLNKPQEMNLAYDSSVNNAGIDGIIFITPIRFSINRVADTGDEATDTDEFAPYAIGDSIYVEVHSITEDAFYFLTEAQIQMTLGDNTIFAPPVSNVPTNIISPSETPEEVALGIFCVSEVSGLGGKIE